MHVRRFFSMKKVFVGLQHVPQWTFGSRGPLGSKNEFFQRCSKRFREYFPNIFNTFFDIFGQKWNKPKSFQHVFRPFWGQNMTFCKHFFDFFDTKLTVSKHVQNTSQNNFRPFFRHFSTKKKVFQNMPRMHPNTFSDHFFIIF